jgi:hypothetical protein
MDTFDILVNNTGGNNTEDINVKESIFELNLNNVVVTYQVIIDESTPHYDIDVHDTKISYLIEPSNIFFTSGIGDAPDEQVYGRKNGQWVLLLPEQNLLLGELHTNAYYGDLGKIAYDHSQSTGNVHELSFSGLLNKPTTVQGYGITNIPTWALSVSKPYYTTIEVTEEDNLYFTTNRVLGTYLNGYVATDGNVNASDTVLSAIEKLSYKNHNPLTLGSSNGLTLDEQELSLGLSSTNSTGSLSFTDWNTFNNKLSSSLMGVANGLATLGSDTKIPLSQIPVSLLGQVNYKGLWDASTGLPSLPSTPTSNGDYYIVSVAGSTTMGSISEWKVGDWLIANGSVWGKVDNTDAVSSVNGYVGTVVLNKSDIGLSNVSNVLQWSTDNHPTTTSGYGLPNYPTTLPASDVYLWAKESVKPSYVWTEIGNRPTLLSQFSNDLGNYGNWVVNTDSRLSDSRIASDVYNWAKTSTKPSYTYSEITSKPTLLSQFTNDLGNYGGFVTGTPWTLVGYWYSSNHPSTLSGYGITDTPWTNYLPLSGGQESGNIGFNQGLGISFVNGGYLKNNSNGLGLKLTAGANNLTFESYSTIVQSNSLYLQNLNGSSALISFQGTQIGAKEYNIKNSIDGVSNIGFSIRNYTDSTTPMYIDGSDNVFFKNYVTATQYKVSGGTSSQFLKGDGSLDSTTYQPLGSAINTGNISAQSVNYANSAGNSNQWGGYPIDFNQAVNVNRLIAWDVSDNKFRVADNSSIKSWLGLGSSAYTNTSAFQPAITGLTINYIPKWNGSNMVNSLISDDGSDNAYYYIGNANQGGINLKRSGGAVYGKFGIEQYGVNNDTYIGSFSNNGLGLYSTGTKRLYIRNTGEIDILSTTLSTSPTTGALVVDGGIGVSGSGYFNGNITASSFIKSGGTSSQLLLADGSVVNISAIGIDQTQTSINGSVSGTVICSMPFQTNSYKKVVLKGSPFGGSATYTFPVAFTAFGQPSYYITGAITITSLSSTSITINASSTSAGYVVLEGY